MRDRAGLILIVLMSAGALACAKHSSEGEREGGSKFSADSNFSANQTPNRKLVVHLDVASQLQAPQIADCQKVVKDDRWKKAFADGGLDIEFAPGSSIAALGATDFSETDVVDVLKAQQKQAIGVAVSGVFLTEWRNAQGFGDPNILGVAVKADAVEGIAIFANSLSNNQDELLRTTMHEVGHALGLTHCNGDSRGRTIMNTVACLSPYRHEFIFSPEAINILRKGIGDLQREDSCCLYAPEGAYKFGRESDRSSLRFMVSLADRAVSAIGGSIGSGQPLVVRTSLKNLGSSEVGVRPLFAPEYGVTVYEVQVMGRWRELTPLLLRETRQERRRIRPMRTLDDEVEISLCELVKLLPTGGRVSLRAHFYGLDGNADPSDIVSNAIDFDIGAAEPSDNRLMTDEVCQFIALGSPEALASAVPYLMQVSQAEGPLAGYAELALGRYFDRDVPRIDGSAARRADLDRAAFYLGRAAVRNLPTFFRARLHLQLLRIMMQSGEKKDERSLRELVRELRKDSKEDALVSPLYEAAVGELARRAAGGDGY
jgi:hypothetical protein